MSASFNRYSIFLKRVYYRISILSRGRFSFSKKDSLLFAQVRGKCRLRAAGPHPPIFFPKKENGRCDRPKERRLIGSPKLEQPLCLRNATVCARRSRVSFARRFASASTTRCCSADLAQVQPNRRLPIIRYRGERQQCRLGRQAQDCTNPK